MINYSAVNDLHLAIRNFGLIRVLSEVFGKGAKIKLWFSKKGCDTDICDLNLSVRSYNCLKRANVSTVGQLIDVINKDQLLSIRNLGANSRAEIRVKALEFGYLNCDEKEQKEFVKELLNLNTESIQPC